MDYIGKKCLVCEKSFQENDDIVVCPRCGAPYHRECYKEKGKCILTDLHKNKQSWREVYDKESVEEEKKANEKVSCPVCGAENPSNAIVCEKCGNFIGKKNNSVYESFKEMFDYDGEEDEGSEDDKEADENDPSKKFERMGIGKDPFSVFLDPMGGVPKDEDFDGVTAAEVTKYVKTNTQYYLPIFARIKHLGQSRLNFCAFLFTGIWYLFRKQYLKGAILSLVYIAIQTTNLFIAKQSTDLWIQMRSSIVEATGVIEPTYRGYIDYMSQNLSTSEIVIAMLPFALTMIMWTIRIVCAVKANKGYYRHSVKKVKKLRERYSGEELKSALESAGGTNSAIAFSMAACYMIIAAAGLFI